MWTLISLAVAAHGLLPPRNTTTEYPLFTISNKRTNMWSDEDVRVVASGFVLSDGLPDEKGMPGLLSRLQAANPSMTKVRYCNTRGISLSVDNTYPAKMSLEEFERNYRLQSLFTTGGWLNTALSADSGDTKLKLDHPLKYQSRDENHCALRNWTLVPSAPGSGDLSRKAADGTVEVVTYIRVDDEIMKIVSVAGAENRGHSEPPFDKDPGPPATLVVVRGFGGTEPAAHAVGARVLTPVSLDGGVTPPVRNLEWAVALGEGTDEIARQLLVNYTLQDIADGFDGAWWDNYGASITGSSTLTGCYLRVHEMFHQQNPSGSWNRPDLLGAQRDRYQQTLDEVTKLRRKVPVIANGYGNFGWPNGSCECDSSPCASFKDAEETFKKGFVDAWILEGFFGHNLLPPGCSCSKSAQCGTISYNNEKDWKSNVQSVMVAAQADPPLPVFPIIAQAGCKSPSLEGQSTQVRDKFETAGYASYLMAIESRDGPITFGIYAMYRENKTAVPYARVHPRYFWPIGDPDESHPPEDFEKYQRGSVSYGRKFTNGFVIYNPTSNVTDAGVALPPGATYVDPETGNPVHKVDLPPHTGAIFLKTNKTTGAV